MRTGSKGLILAFCAGMALVPAVPFAGHLAEPDEAVPRQPDPSVVPVAQGPRLAEIHAAIMDTADAAEAKATPDGGLAEARRLESVKIEAEMATLEAMQSLDSLDASQREALARSRAMLADLLAPLQRSGIETGGGK